MGHKLYDYFHHIFLLHLSHKNAYTMLLSGNIKKNIYIKFSPIYIHNIYKKLLTTDYFGLTYFPFSLRDLTS